MPTKKPASSWTFTSDAALLAWLEDEYLSALQITALSPAPGSKSKTVRFTWRLDTPGTVIPYAVEAKQVARWTLEGAHEDVDLSLLPATGKAPAPIEVVMLVPGRLTLWCGSLKVTRGRAKRKPRSKRPFTDYTYFTVDQVGTVTLDRLRASLTDDPRLVLKPLDPHGSLALCDGTRVVAAVAYSAEAHGGWLSISRRQGTDAEWHRCQALPRTIRGREIAAPWETFVTPEEWLALVRAP